MGADQALLHNTDMLLQVLLHFGAGNPFFLKLLCNDASSPCQYFNALIDVTSLTVPNNLKWAFKHSYWNIDVLAVWLNHWLQGAVFCAVISGDNLAKTRAWLFYQQILAETQAWIKGLPRSLMFRQSQDDFGKFQGINSHSWCQVPAEGRALLRVSPRQPHLHGPLHPLQRAPTHGCRTAPCPEQQ